MSPMVDLDRFVLVRDIEGFVDRAVPHTTIPRSERWRCFCSACRRAADVGQPIQSRVLHQRCGERETLKLNGYFEWPPHQTRH
jgi:hypothetical protein